MSARESIDRFLQGELDFAGLRDDLVRIAPDLSADREALTESLQGLRRSDNLSETQYQALLEVLKREDDGSSTLAVNATLRMSDTEIAGSSPPDPANLNVAGDARHGGGDPSRPPPGSRRRSKIAIPTWSSADDDSPRSANWSDLEYDADRKLPGVGDVLNDRFILAKLIGRGGMGLVFQALDLRKEEAQDRNPYLALKILSEEFKRHPDALKALQREARKSQSLSHPNIVNVFDFDRDGDTVYMTMEFLDGLPLDLLIERYAALPINTQDALGYIRQMSAGLAYAHARGVVHSDFKPGNVFLTADGSIKILDFGIARATTGQALDDDTAFDAQSLGALTPAYASLEMLLGVDPHPGDDIYALGCTAYELLSGRHPFRNVRADLALKRGLEPHPLRHIKRNQWRAIASALAFRREDRLTSIEEFLGQFDQTSARRRGMQLSVGAAAVTLVVVAGLLVPGQLREAERRSLQADLTSGEVERVLPALDEVAGFDSEERHGVLSASSNALLRFFSARAAEAFAVDEQRYDFPTALSVLERALSLYAFNDAAVQVLQGRLDAMVAEKNHLLGGLDYRFRNRLSALERGDATVTDELLEVLNTVEEIDPAHPILIDARLPPAFLGAARRAVANGEYRRASDLLGALLPRFPEESALRNEIARIDRAARRATLAADVSRLEDEVERAWRDVDSIAGLPALGELSAQLVEADPDNPALEAARERAAALVEAAVGEQLGQSRFNAARRLLEDNRAYLEAGSAAALASRINAAGSAREEQLTALMDRVRRAAAAGDIGPGSTAAQALAALEAASPEDDLLMQGRALLFDAHLQQSDRLRAGSNWDGARAALAAASPYVGTQDDRRRIERAQGAIEQAVVNEQFDREQRAAREAQEQRREDAQRLRRRLSELMAAPDLNADDVSLALRLVEQLRVIAPEDPAVREAPDALAERLTQRTSVLRRAGEYAAARQLVNDGLELLPASAGLADERRAIDASERAAGARAQEARVDKLRREIDRLVAAPTFSETWDRQLSDRLTLLEATGDASDREVTALRNRIATMFANAAAAARREGRFAEARRLIDSGRGYRSDYGSWDTELRLIELAEARRQRREEPAEPEVPALDVDALKQSFSTSVQALDVQSAENTYRNLRAAAPRDTFVTAAAPRMLAEAYVFLADLALRQGDYERVQNLAAAGLVHSPDAPELLAAQGRALREGTKEHLVEVLSGEKSELGIPPRELLERLRQLYGGSAADEMEDVARKIALRLRRLAASDSARAETLRREAAALLPGISTLESL